MPFCSQYLEGNYVNNRIKYLDVAKFVGIFCIYLGHFGHQAGNAYGFVFTFHVPLFFFLAGCTENLGADASFVKYIIKNQLYKNILDLVHYHVMP